MASGYAPLNGTRPVNISYNTTPSAHTSLRASASSPRACSGDMYATVPIVDPGIVNCSESANFARPKSRILTPSSVIIRLPGLTSRCTTPCACAFASPSAISVAISSASAIGSAPRSSFCFSVWPS